MAFSQCYAQIRCHAPFAVCTEFHHMGSNESCLFFLANAKTKWIGALSSSQICLVTWCHPISDPFSMPAILQFLFLNKTELHHFVNGNILYPGSNSDIGNDYLPIRIPPNRWISQRNPTQPPSHMKTQQNRFRHVGLKFTTLLQ